MDILVRLEQGEFIKAGLGDHLALAELNLACGTMLSCKFIAAGLFAALTLSKIPASPLGTEDRSRPRLRAKDSRDTTLQKPRRTAGEGACAPDPLGIFILLLEACIRLSCQRAGGHKPMPMKSVSRKLRSWTLLFATCIALPYPSLAQPGAVEKLIERMKKEG